MFVLCTPHHGSGAAAEGRQAVGLADAALAAGAAYLVYTSAAGALRTPGMPMPDGRRRVEEPEAT